MLGLVSISDWLVPEALRNTILPPLALVSVVVLTVAPLPTGDMLSASHVVDCAWAVAAQRTVVSRAAHPRRSQAPAKLETIRTKSERDWTRAFMAVEGE